MTTWNKVKTSQNFAGNHRFPMFLCFCWRVRVFRLLAFLSGNVSLVVVWKGFFSKSRFCEASNATNFCVGCVFLHSDSEICFSLTFVSVPVSLDLALQWRLCPGLHHTYTRRRCVVSPCLPTFCSFSTVFSNVFPFANVTGFWANLPPHTWPLSLIGYIYQNFAHS